MLSLHYRNGEKMKKLIAIALLVITLVALTVNCFPYSLSHYNTTTKQIICNGSDCIHEIGHYLDQKGGWVSSTKEFRDAFKTTKWYGINGYPSNHDIFINDPITLYISIFGWGGWKEFYANTFYTYFGCENLMPESIRKFYDFRTSDPMIDHMVFDTDSICPIIDNHVMALSK